MNIVDLPLQRRRIPRPSLTGEWDLWRNEAHVIRAMVSRSGLVGKVIADRIGVAESILSKAQQNDPRARLQEDQIDRLMDVCESEAWLFYWIAKRGYDPASLRRRQTEVEEENESLRAQMDEMRKERKFTLDLLRDARGAA